MLTGSDEKLIFDSTPNKIWVEEYEREGLPVYWEGAFVNPAEVKRFPDAMWAFAAEPVRFLLNAEEVLALAVDRLGHSVRELVSDVNVDRLQEILDDWAMSLCLNEYIVDEDRIVVFDRALYDVSSKGPDTEPH